METHKKVMDKIFSYAKKAKDSEVGGFLLGTKFTNGDYEIEDAIILKQHKRDIRFQLDDDALMDFTKNAKDDELNKVIGWWHSHANMDVFYSADDDATFKRLAKFFGYNACVGVVVNLKGKQHWRVMVLTKGDTFVDIDNIQVSVKEDKTPIVIDTSDYDYLVIDDKSANTDFYDVCPTCKGTGYAKATKTKGKKRLSIFGEVFDGFNEEEGYYLYDDYGQKKSKKEYDFM